MHRSPRRSAAMARAGPYVSWRWRLGPARFGSYFGGCFSIYRTSSMPAFGLGCCDHCHRLLFETAHYFLDGPICASWSRLGLSWSCRFTHRVAPWQVLTRRVAVAGRGASMIRLFGGLTTEQKYPVLLEYAKASFERIKQRLRHL